jgi:hypothetical protein
MAERNPDPLPEPEEPIAGISQELSIDPNLKLVLNETYPLERIFAEEAPTTDGRYMATSCLGQIVDLSLRHSPLDGPLLLSAGDVRWIYKIFHGIVEGEWESMVRRGDLSEPFPGFTLVHLFGATKHRISHLNQLKQFHETDALDRALDIYHQVGFVIHRAITDGGPDPQYLDK